MRALSLITLLSASLIAGCSGGSLLKPNSEIIPIDSSTTNEDEKKTGLKDEFEVARSKAKRDKAAVPSFVEGGISLSDAHCNVFLDRLNSTDQQTSIWQDALNILGAGAIAIAGLNGSSSESLGKAAAGIAAGNAMFESYRANILLAPANAITTKVKEYRETQATMLRTESMDVTYDRAVGWLLHYHDTCSPKAIRQLVADSLAAVAYVPPKRPDLPPAERAEAEQLKSRISQALNGITGAYSDDFYYRLYVVLNNQDKIANEPFKTYAAIPGVASANKTLEDLSESSAGQYRVATLALERLAEILQFDARLQTELREAEDAENLKKAPVADKPAIQKLIDNRQQLERVPTSNTLRPQIVAQPR